MVYSNEEEDDSVNAAKFERFEQGRHDPPAMCPDPRRSGSIWQGASGVLLP